MRRLGHVRLDVLDTMSTHGMVTKQFIAKELGVSPSAARKLLEALLDKRLVSKRQSPECFRITTRGRARLHQELLAGAVPGVPMKSLRGRT
jgi:predicted ArsR family transcriptional regulator